MEKASTLGTILGIVAIALGLVLAGGSMMSLLQGSALIVVLGATLGATLVSHSGSELRSALARIKTVYRAGEAWDPAPLLEEILAFAAMVRKEGLLAAEAMRAEVHDPFLKDLLKLVTDGVEGPAVSEAADGEIRSAMAGEIAAAQVFESAGTYAPSAGVLGAVIALVPALTHLDDSALLGAGIASAFVSTIYGLGLSTLLFLPWNAKLLRKAEEKERHSELVKAGVMGILEGLSPHFLEAKLKALVGKPS